LCENSTLMDSLQQHRCLVYYHDVHWLDVSYNMFMQNDGVSAQI